MSANSIIEFREKKITDICCNIVTFLKYVTLPRPNYIKHDVNEVNVSLTKYVLEEIYDCKKLTLIDFSNKNVPDVYDRMIRDKLKIFYGENVSINNHAVVIIYTYVENSVDLIAGESLKNIETEKTRLLVQNIQSRTLKLNDVLAEIKSIYAINPEDITQLKLALTQTQTLNENEEIRKQLKKKLTDFKNRVNMRKEMSNIITKQIEEANERLEGQNKRISNLDLQISNIKNNPSYKSGIYATEMGLDLSIMKQLDTLMDEIEIEKTGKTILAEFVIDLQESRRIIREDLTEANVDEYYNDIEILPIEPDTTNYTQIRDDLSVAAQFEKFKKFNKSKKKDSKHKQVGKKFIPVYGDEMVMKQLVSEKYNKTRRLISENFNQIINSLNTEKGVDRLVEDEYNKQFLFKLQYFQDVVSSRKVDGVTDLSDLVVHALSYICIALIDWFDIETIASDEVEYAFKLLVSNSNIESYNSEKYALKNKLLRKFISHVGKFDIKCKIYNKTIFVNIAEYIAEIETQQKTDIYKRFVNRVKFFAHKLQSTI